MWFRCFQPQPSARLKLFCFPHAGGGANLFRQWATLLPPEIEVYGLQLPGREYRYKEPPYTNLPELINQISQALHPYLDKPYALFGHSLGALLSYETVRALRRASQLLPQQLFIAAHRAPQLPHRFPPLHHLPPEQFVDEVDKRYQHIPEQIKNSREAMSLFTPMLQADFTLYEQYNYQREEPLACPIFVLGGRTDALVSRTELRSWRLQTTASFQLRMFPAGHFFPQELPIPVTTQVTTTLNQFLH